MGALGSGCAAGHFQQMQHPGGCLTFSITTNANRLHDFTLHSLQSQPRQAPNTSPPPATFLLSTLHHHRNGASPRASPQKKRYRHYQTSR